jgi:hypothetical protein
MENVPKIVTDRLKTTAVAFDHPDADVLTAFAEHSLTERERNQVMGHLSACAECREVIALALPAEESTMAVARPGAGKWLTWPQLRWGLVTAGVIVAGSFGVLRYRHVTRPAAEISAMTSREDVIAKAKNQAAGMPETAEEAPEQKAVPAKPSISPASPPGSADANKESDHLESIAKLQDAPRDKEVSVGGATVGKLRSQALPHGPKAPMQQWQQNNYTNTNNAFEAQAPAPAATPSAKQQAGNELLVTARPAASATNGSSIGGPLTVGRKDENLDSLAANSRSMTSLTPLDNKSGAEVARAKPAETVVTTPQANAAGAYTVSATESGNFSTSGSLVPESARWAINSAGGLQRSVDQGKTWEDIDVNNGAGTYGAMNLPLAMKSSRAKTAPKDKADSKVKPIIFRAVAANGPDVWAGGAEGNLYHSNDSGSHWVRIIPSWRGIELSADIVSLQFADPQRGRIITSAAEIWTTADGGQSWDKQ